MPTRLYETMFALDATKIASDTEAARASLTALIEKHGGEIVVARPWDENRKLTYPIQKQKKGYFFCVYYKFESTKQAELERDFKLVEIILRQLTSAIDPKWEETMMDVAKNDTATAFAYRGLQDETAPTDVTPNLAGLTGEPGPDGEPSVAGGRRAPRREFAEKPE